MPLSYLEQMNITDIMSWYYNECTLNINMNSNISSGMTDELNFRDINFNTFFVWDEENALKIGNRNIDLIINSKKTINTYRRLPKLKNFKTLSNDSLLLHKYLYFKYSFTHIKQITFNNCKFSFTPVIMDSKVWKIEFNNCEFVSSGGNFAKGLLSDNKQYSKRVIFDNCKFSAFNIGDISDIQYNRDVKLCRFHLNGGEIDRLTIENIELSSKFYINKQYDGNSEITTIENLTIKDSIFKENFKLHNCEVSKIKIKDTDFEKNADFYKSKFSKGLSTDENNNDKTIYFGALNFRSLALFGECIFEERCSFKYVTFEGYSHFRGAEFSKGLDLDYSNIQKEMNFFGVTGLDKESSKMETSQETYRILKHNFQKIGNQIEANKYHALELDIHRQITWKKFKINNTLEEWNYHTQRPIKLLSDLVPSTIHWFSSKYAQSWLLPIFWIFIIGYITNILMFGVEKFDDINGVFQYLSIINLDKDLTDSPKVFLFNKISLGYLYYQFIFATRKNTKK